MRENYDAVCAAIDAEFFIRVQLGFQKRSKYKFVYLNWEQIMKGNNMNEFSKCV